MELIFLYRDYIWGMPMDRKFLAVCTDKETAIKLAVRDAKKCGEPLDRQQTALLRNKNNTEARQIEYRLRTVSTDKLLLDPLYLYI